MLEWDGEKYSCRLCNSGGRGCKTYPSARKHVFQLHPGVAKQGVRVVLKPGTDDESWRIHEENLRSWKEKQASYNAQRMARQVRGMQGLCGLCRQIEQADGVAY